MNEEIIIREQYLRKIVPFVDKSIIKVITGQRRVGKSYILKQLRNKILSENPKANGIIIDKELYEFDFITDYKALYIYVKKNIKKSRYNFLMIDEIQNIEGFEKALRSIYNEKLCDIFISGSNAKMLSGDLATHLSGRYIEFKINSLSYIEFLSFHNLENNDDSLYLFIKYGGMPYLKNLKLSDDVVLPYLKSVFDTIILKDVVIRNNIRNVELLKRLVEYLCDNMGSLITAKRISDYLKSQRMNTPVNTIINYLTYLTNSFFVNKVPRYDIKGKKIFEINEKYYLEDIGIRNCITGFRQIDIAKIIENLVYLHLKYLGFDVKVGNLNSKEIDFVGTKDDKTIYVQVSYLLANEKAVKREFGNLLDIPDNYEKIVVSMDKYAEGNIKGIKHTSLINFLSDV